MSCTDMISGYIFEITQEGCNCNIVFCSIAVLEYCSDDVYTCAKTRSKDGVGFCVTGGVCSAAAGDSWRAGRGGGGNDDEAGGTGRN